MEENNQITKVLSTDIQPLRDALESQEVYAMFLRAAGKQAGNYVISILNAATANPAILKCKPQTVINAGLTAANMSLSLSPALGQASIQPYKKNIPLRKDAKGKVIEWGEEWNAEFSPMVRGYKTMALRTGMYNRLNDFAVYEGQQVVLNQMACFPTVEGQMNINKPITHYGAYLKLNSGYEHCIIWEIEKVLDWAKKYSPTYDDGLIFVYRKVIQVGILICAKRQSFPAAHHRGKLSRPFFSPL